MTIIICIFSDEVLNEARKENMTELEKMKDQLVRVFKDQMELRYKYIFISTGMKHSIYTKLGFQAY